MLLIKFAQMLYPPLMMLSIILHYFSGFVCNRLIQKRKPDHNLSSFHHMDKFYVKNLQTLVLVLMAHPILQKVFMLKRMTAQAHMKLIVLRVLYLVI